ncbi:ADP-ribosylglycohydrolase family protein [Rapidithrix thailandica]|uniref:ADP-ribosylglycohydrolase family protein n=1 Tax=Rapidithrix thailandica TaxID=413964 RepID=A0AAW9S733_9BACT
MKGKIEGCVFGMAIGDGFGLPTEFLSFQEILEKWPPKGLMEPLGNPIMVSDDTQMAIAVAKALIENHRNGLQPLHLEKSLSHYFIEWLNDPENTRAPGMTCIDACEKLERGLHWLQASSLNSKGCGANMRVATVGLLGLKGYDQTTIAKVAQLQAAITHGHPTALAASELTAIAIERLIHGVGPEKILEYLTEYAEKQRTVYHTDYLQSVWDRPPFHSPEAFIEKGWDECSRVLQKVKTSLREQHAKEDPCLLTGAGWVAEESFATGLFCFLLHPDDPVQALRRAVNSSGDSDSIACLTGAFSGAYCGIEAFPVDWVERIEYQQELEEIVKFFQCTTNPLPKNKGNRNR